MPYSCKCGQEVREAEPPACARCWVCRTNIADSPERLTEPLPHLWNKSIHEGVIVTQCGFCGRIQASK